MSNENKMCEVCGSTEITAEISKSEIKVLYGPNAVYESIVISCKSCGEKIDATDDELREQAIETAEAKSLESMIEHIGAHGYSLSAIERALGLPMRTISRWKSGKDPSAAGLTLLRMIRTFPWLLDIAKAGYDENFSAVKLISEAFDVIEKKKKDSISSENRDALCETTAGVSDKGKVSFTVVNLSNEKNDPSSTNGLPSSDLELLQNIENMHPIHASSYDSGVLTL